MGFLAWHHNQVGGRHIGETDMRGHEWNHHLESGWYQWVSAVTYVTQQAPHLLVDQTIPSQRRVWLGLEQTNKLIHYSSKHLSPLLPQSSVQKWGMYLAAYSTKWLKHIDMLGSLESCFGGWDAALIRILSGYNPKSARLCCWAVHCTSPHLSWWYLHLQMYCYWGHEWDHHLESRWHQWVSPDT